MRATLPLTSSWVAVRCSSAQKLVCRSSSARPIAMPDHATLEQARELGVKESGLSVVVTNRADGSAQTSVVNAGVLEHPVTAEPIVGFVARGGAKKLMNLRARPRVTVVFRSGWEWVAVEGDAELAGPGDEVDGIGSADIAPLLRAVYAAAVGGTADDWVALDDTMAAEGHTAVLVNVARLY